MQVILRMKRHPDRCPTRAWDAHVVASASTPPLSILCGTSAAVSRSIWAGGVQPQRVDSPPNADMDDPNEWGSRNDIQATHSSSDITPSTITSEDPMPTIIWTSRRIDAIHSLHDIPLCVGDCNGCSV